MADQTWDFDDGTSQGWSLSSETDATASVDGAAALNGSSYGLSFVWSSQNSNECYADETLTNAYSDLYVRFRLKIISGSAGQYAGTYIRFFIPCVSSVFNAMSRIDLYWDGATWSLRDLLTSTDIDLATDTEYDVEIRCLRDATAGGFQIWIDGTLELDELDHDTSGSDLQYLNIGAYLTSGNITSGSGLYIDEIEVDSARIGGGGTTYDVSCADGVDLGDSTSATLLISVSASDGLSAADGPGGSLAIPAAVVDSVLYGDSPLGAFSFGVEASDGVVLADQVTEGGTIEVSVADGVSLGDATTAALDILGTVADGIELGDSASTTVQITATIADGVMFSDAISAAIAYLVSVSDGIELSDIAVDTTFLPVGRVRITVSTAQASVTITALHPSASVTSSVPSASVTEG